MTTHDRLSPAILLIILASVASAQTPAPDLTQGALPRHVWSAVQDSLNGGGRREDQVLFAASPLSERVFRAVNADVRTADSAAAVICPGSTDSTSAPIAGPVGYRVHVRLSERDDSTYVLAVSKSCRFIFRGSPPKLNSTFAEALSWEVRREGRTWRIGRRIGHIIS